MILVHNDLTKDSTSRNFVHIEVHTQLHSATRVTRKLLVRKLLNLNNDKAYLTSDLILISSLVVLESLNLIVDEIKPQHR